jgi:hypothetical protein
MSHKEEPELNVSPAADEAMAKLVELFSDPSLASKAQFRCCVDGPTEFEVLLESIVDEQFGYNPNSEYKRWVRSLYRLGLILRIPSEWEAPENVGSKITCVTTHGGKRGAPNEFPRIDSCVFHPRKHDRHNRGHCSMENGRADWRTECSYKWARQVLNPSLVADSSQVLDQTQCVFRVDRTYLRAAAWTFHLHNHAHRSHLTLRVHQSHRGCRRRQKTARPTATAPRPEKRGTYRNSRNQFVSVSHRRRAGKRSAWRSATCPGPERLEWQGRHERSYAGSVA